MPIGGHMEVLPSPSAEAGLEKSSIDWKSYSTQYDLLARNNPSYQENIEALKTLVAQWDLPKDAAICDLGAGTGNFICALSSRLPDAKFFHVDRDANMNRIALEKYRLAGVKDVAIIEEDALNVEFPPKTFDLVICVNALYAMPDPENILGQVRSWLKPEGRLFIIDFGRQANLFDWGKYIFGNIYRTEGLGACIRFVKNGLETIKQNRNGSKGQARGGYWLHSTDEFGSVLSKCGFHVVQLSVCYRGYCDLAVCTPNQT